MQGVSDGACGFTSHVTVCRSIGSRTEKCERPLVDQISVVFCINVGTEKDKEIAPVFLPSLQTAQYTIFGNGAQPMKKFTRSESEKPVENDLTKNNVAAHSHTGLVILTFCFFPLEKERGRERGRAN